MKKSNLILVIFIIFIMVSSVIGFIYAPNDNGDLNQNLITYNGLDFQLTTDNRYVVDLNGNQILFDNDPNSLEEIILPNFQITQDKVYLIFNPEERDNNLDYSMAKLYSTLQVKGVRPVLACSKEENCSSDLPVKGCDSESFYFILIVGTYPKNNYFRKFLTILAIAKDDVSPGEQIPTRLIIFW